MYTAKIENRAGNVYVLTGAEAVYQVVDISGLNPPQATINLTPISGIDGALFNSSRLETRNIVLMIKINGDVEVNRQNLYNYFVTKEWCRFYYSNGRRNVYIDGRVESVECGLFTNAEMAQISIICPQPYFKAVDQMVVDISNTLAQFTFPFSIEYDEPEVFSSLESARVTNLYNDSASETGCLIDIDFIDAVNKLEIKNVETGESLILQYTFLANDSVLIDTQIGQKSVKLTRNGVQSNLFAAVQKGSTFFQLRAGDNFFGYLADDGASDNDVLIRFRYHTTYRGV